MDYHDEVALSPRELAWKKDALEVAKGLVEKYTGTEEGYLFDVGLLDDAFENVMKESWWKRQRKFILITGFGYALGQYLVDKLGFEWLVYKDYQGKDVAVKHVASGIICFPISSLRKRMKTREYRFMKDYVNELVKELKKATVELAPLHYVSQSNASLSHLEAIENACKAGCKWVQLRMKNVSYQEYLDTAIAAKAICERHQALLTINDNPKVALASKAGGLHLGKEDMSPTEARKIVGDIVIGGTANAWEDIVRLSKEPINYIGLGPFRYTSTKEKLSPILGLEGYKKLLKKMEENGIDIPVFAIGGIQLEDVEAIQSTGISGIAVSGLITNADDPTAICESINNMFAKG